MPMARRVLNPRRKSAINTSNEDAAIGPALSGGDLTMPIEKIDTLVVGGGQAGIAMSEHLGNHGIPHLVLERQRIAERWRSGRWDSLVANGPAWHDRFPGMAFDAMDPEAFAPKEAVADYFEAYARKINAPMRCGVEVTSVGKKPGQNAFEVETSKGRIEAIRVVAATGPFQNPVIPDLIPGDEKIFQIHSVDYRNPDQLPQGAVMVVGAGSSGAQIAEELCGAGRRVFLSVGPHGRPPRRYRGHDYCWWLGVFGKWDVAEPAPGSEHVTISVSGADGGHTMDFRRLAAKGITLVGRAEAYTNGKLEFAGNLAEIIAKGDADYLSVLDEADDYIARNGLTLPEEPEARVIPADPPCVSKPVRQLDLSAEGITSVIWATGYRPDYRWLKVDAFDEKGKPRHHRGVSVVPGIYFLGLPWLSRRGSSFIWGVWHDAKYLADQIGIQRSYMQYHQSVHGEHSK
jgi:putative flavoprotein involved in K+ transport